MEVESGYVVLWNCRDVFAYELRMISFPCSPSSYNYSACYILTFKLEGFRECLRAQAEDT